MHKARSQPIACMCVLYVCLALFAGRFFRADGWGTEHRSIDYRYDFTSKDLKHPLGYHDKPAPFTVPEPLVTRGVHLLHVCGQRRVQTCNRRAAGRGWLSSSDAHANTCFVFCLFPGFVVVLMFFLCGQQ